MSDEQPTLDDLRAASERLDVIAAGLADQATTDEQAVDLAREASEIAAGASSAAARIARAAAERGTT